MRIVQKYGGTSLGDLDKIRAAAQRIGRLAQQGAQVVVVVSAQADTTDTLLTDAAAINPRGSARELDAYLATGEQMSASLMAMAVGALGIPAVSLTGFQAGIQTDNVYGNARILNIDTQRIEQELEKGNVVVVAGFQGYDEKGNITTLGRGGSDTTAVALAAWLNADLCQIYTDVDGVYDKDPRKYPDARRFGRVSYDHMLRLAHSGAQVLHDRCVELAKERNIRLEVLSAFTCIPGTIVGP